MTAHSDTLSAEDPYVGYAYGYPHKSAYRRLATPIPLATAWSAEARDALFLYLHVPFCEYRCGFCNLFTLAGVDNDLPGDYLRQLRRQAEAVSAALPDARFARAAIGGGTPTYLEEGQLAALFDLAEAICGVDCRGVPTSVEASPATATKAKLSLLRERGVERLSLGVQTFDDRQSQRLGRPQRASEARAAAELVCSAGFPTVNFDLIYGAPGQSTSDWERDVATALEYGPTEVFLYPLYIRPQTGLGTRARPADSRLACYRAGRQLLLDAGYAQISMRMFRRGDCPPVGGPAYCCQSDGMVGLGCGARSYTSRLHYSTEFAVGRTGVRAILATYLQGDSERFSCAEYGATLDDDDLRRRFALLGLLQSEGLDLAAYARKFGAEPKEHLPELTELVERGLASEAAGSLQLTPAGLELSDAIGPWLYSPRVARLMEAFECL